MKPTVDELKLFAHLAGLSPKLREYLQRQFDAYVQVLLQHKGADEFRNAQGRAAVYQELLNLLDTAGPTLKKIESTGGSRFPGSPESF